MRGTLLDRLGYAELALKAWQEALELRPENATLRRFIERKRKVRERNIAGSSR
jgi:predicted RNA polymerase sigma factor